MSEQQGAQFAADLWRWLRRANAAALAAYQPNLAQATGTLPGKHLPTGGPAGTGYPSSPHALDGPLHTGTLSDAQHGSRAGGALHALASGAQAGFQSSADKSKSDLYPSISGLTAGQVLTATGAASAAFAAPPAGFVSPLTTRGDLLTQNPSGTHVRLAIGASGTFLRSGGTDPAWAALAAADIPAHNQPWSTITATPTTLAGYGITDALSSTATRAANTLYAGPASGAAAAPTWRALVALDIPALDAAAITSGTLAIANGGTGAATALAAFAALSPMTARGDLITRGATAPLRTGIGAVGSFLRSSGVDPIWALLVAADIPALDAAKITTGVLPPAQGGTGVNNGTNALTVPATGTAALVARDNQFVVAQGIRGAASGQATGLYVPWVTGDANATAYIGALTGSNTQVALAVESGTNTALSLRSTTGAAFTATMQDAATAGVPTLVRIGRNSSAAAGNGYGTAVVFQLKSSTTNSQDAGQQQIVWSDATHATRTSYMAFQLALSGTLTEKARVTGEGALWLGKASGGLTSAGSLDAAGSIRTGAGFTNVGTIAKTVPSSAITPLALTTNDATNPLTITMNLATNAAQANRYAFIEAYEGGTKMPISLQAFGGAVWIGATTSTYQGYGELDVAGSVRIARGVQAGGALQIGGTTYLSHFNYGSAETTHIRAGKAGAMVYINDNVVGNVAIAPNGGYVGIGTATPSRVLSVNDATNTYMSYKIADSEKWVVGVEGSNSNRFTFYDTSAGVHRLLINNAGNVSLGPGSDQAGTGVRLMIYGTNTGTNTYGLVVRSSAAVDNLIIRDDGYGYIRAASWAYGSDERLKTRRRALPYGLAELLQLEPEIFDYIDGQKAMLGFIAQQVQPLLPELVREGPNGMLSLFSDGVIPIVVRALQQIDQRIRALEHPERPPV